jgi:hypothetical protein
MKMYQKIVARMGAIATGIVTPIVVAAQSPLDRAQKTLTDVQTKAQLRSTTLPDLIGSIINAVLGVLGIILLIYIVYAGFLWMTAAGDEGKVKTAKTMIQNAIIGLVLILASVAIANFVIGALTQAGL